MNSRQIKRLREFCFENELDTAFIDTTLTYEENMNILESELGISHRQYFDDVAWLREKEKELGYPLESRPVRQGKKKKVRVFNVQYVRPLPEKVRTWITPIKGGYRPMSIVGFDSETVRENFYSCQTYDSEGGHMFLDRISGLEEIARHDLAFAFNLEFDLFNMIPEPFRKYAFSSEPFQVGGYVFIVRYGHPLTAYLIDLKRKTKTKVRDLMAFFPKHNLEYIGGMIGVPKLKSPPYLGERMPLNQNEERYFHRYAVRDAEIVYRASSFLLDLMKSQDVSTSAYSIPHLTSLLFRKRFLGQNIHVPKETIALAWNSYYGGRAECFQRGEVKGAQIFDFNSMYPYALTFPYPTNGFEYVDRFIDDDKRLGFYFVEGRYTSDLPFGILPVRQETRGGLNLTFPLGKVKGYYASPELGTFLEYGRIENARGITFNKSEPIFKRYIDFIYCKKKRQQKGSPSYELYKLFMNSFYGKFAQQNDDNSAGVMFDPYVAALITSYARNVLLRHMLRTKNVLYVNTDSIITTDIFQTGSRLGELSRETSGLFTGIRSRLFLIEKNGRVLKFAFHGANMPRDIEGFAFDLKRAFLERRPSYVYQIPRMVRPKEAQKRKEKRTFSFERRVMRLDLRPDPKRVWPRYFGESLPLVLE